MLFFYVKQQKHCHHIVLCATVCHMDVEKWRAIFLEEKAANSERVVKMPFVKGLFSASLKLCFRLTFNLRES